MRQQNMPYAGPMLDVEPQQLHHHHHHRHHHHHNPGNRITFDPRYVPENHGQLPYLNSQHNCEHCNTHMIPSSSTGIVSAPVNHNHFQFLNNNHIFERNRSMFMDGSNGTFKRSGSSFMTSEGNRATGAMGFDFDPVMVRNSSHLVHGGQVVQPASFSWNHAHGVPYMQDTGARVYQIAGVRRNSPAFIPHHMRPHNGSHNVYYPPPPPPPPMLPVQTQNMDIHLQLPSTSHRRSTRTSSAYRFQNDANPRPTFVGPPLPHGVMVNRLRRQHAMIDAVSRHRSFRRLILLQEDALLALSELMSFADVGLSDEFISDNLKTRTFVSFKHQSEDSTPADEEPTLCVICQMEFEDQENIGMLDCRHEYHVECIKKWLIIKNSCPVCKNIALH